MEFLKVLTRNEMKMVKGGDPNTSCEGTDGFCLVCYTPNGSESWCRSSGGDADTECQTIYPAYGSSVTGDWATCSSRSEPPEMPVG